MLASYKILNLDPHVAILVERTMQMMLRLIETCMIALTAASLSVSCEAAESKPGGYAPTSVASKDVMAVATFAVETQQNVIREQPREESTKLELVSIQAAEQQVVSGINYRLKLKVKQNDRDRTAEAIVWLQAWRKPDPYRLTSWRWE
jgi:hypothetical protein